MLSITSRVISSKARNLAECTGEKVLLGETKVSFVATDANAPRRSCVRSLGASLCRDDTIDEILVLVDNCYIISYCSTYWYTNYVSSSVRSKYPCWIAEWNTKCTYSGNTICGRTDALMSTTAAAAR